MAAYSGCGERDGGIGHGKRRSRTGLARVGGDVGALADGAPSGLEWNGSQPGQGATELGFPRPALVHIHSALRLGNPLNKAVWAWVVFDGAEKGSENCGPGLAVQHSAP